MIRKNMKKISIALAACLLLGILPLSVMAEKGAAVLAESIAAETVEAGETPASEEQDGSAEGDRGTASNAGRDGSASGKSASTATKSDAVRRPATASDAEREEREEELPDEELINDLPAEEEIEDGAIETAAAETAPAETEAVEELEPAGPSFEELAGTWTVDGVTTYRFFEDGTGELVLPEHTYPFTCTAEEGEYRLEFDSSSVSSAEFHISLENDTMTMERLTDQGTASYQLTRTDD